MVPKPGKYSIVSIVADVQLSPYDRGKGTTSSSDVLNQAEDFESRADQAKEHASELADHEINDASSQIERAKVVKQKTKKRRIQ